MKPFRQYIHDIIFRHDTRAGRLFDIVLLWLISLSVLVVVLESMPSLQPVFRPWFGTVEWIFTFLFLIEFIFRVWSHDRPLNYVFSFWGIVDIAAILPSFLELLFEGTHYLLLIRIFRLLRVFRILRMVHYNREAALLLISLRKSWPKITIFFAFISIMVIILGTLMYVIEGGQNGFVSIPQSIYWAIVTITTVGFGDIVPKTILGKLLASLAMIIGYSVIAVPTGIITVDLARSNRGLKCNRCRHANPSDANYCNQCGEPLPDSEAAAN